MTISVFDLFSIGIGPSSSHTVGPMRAAATFARVLENKNLLTAVWRIQIDLYGSLACTGKGHGTDNAIVLGLEGSLPATIDPYLIPARIKKINTQHQLKLNNTRLINFLSEQDLVFHFKEVLPEHSNGMRFSAFAADNHLLVEQVYYSIGGGFILNAQEFTAVKQENPLNSTDVPFPFENAKQLVTHCEAQKMTIAELMWTNEQTWRSKAQIKEGILGIATIMQQCIDEGCKTEGELPGGLRVRRRAPQLFKTLTAKTNSNASSVPEHPEIMNWINLFALAVNEQNAAGGRIVTAPTNGAAGIIPAVLAYYKNFCKLANEEGVINFLLTAAAIAILYKKGASISAAEVGCQGEVGVACSMAAAGLTAALGGSLAKIEKAAEIGMEHHLGLTCDPIGGLVQIPCIERNAMGSVKAVNIAYLVLAEEIDEHKVSLDKVIATMKQTGKDMMTIYKETSQGGLAVNLPEC